MEPIVKVGNAADRHRRGRNDRPRHLARVLVRRVRHLGRLDHRGHRPLGRRRRLGQRTGAAYMQGMTKAEELQAAGQTGPNAELLALNRTSKRRLVPCRRHRRRAADPHRHDLEAGRMTGLLAAIRPDDWNFPLFLHVLGAMILVGGTLTGAIRARLRPRRCTQLLRLGYWSLLVVGTARATSLMWVARPLDLLQGRAGRSPRSTPRGRRSASSSPRAGVLFAVSLIVGGIGVRRLATAAAPGC